MKIRYLPRTLDKDSGLMQMAAEIKVRAKRRLGEMLREQKETVGLAQGQRRDLLVDGEEVKTPTLKEIGISHDLSSRSQQLAAMPAELKRCNKPAGTPPTCKPPATPGHRAAGRSICCHCRPRSRVHRSRDDERRSRRQRAPSRLASFKALDSQPGASA